MAAHGSIRVARSHQRLGMGIDSIRSQLHENEFLVSDVPPGSVLLVGKVAVFNVAGRFCATHSICTHRGGLLSDGTIEDTTVTCPLHGSQFDVCTGAVLHGPAKDPLETHRVIVDGDVGRVEAR